MIHQLSDQAKKILSLLQTNCLGRENAKSINELSEGFSIDRREFERCTEEIRELGVPLASACGKPRGLYIARNYAELEQWLKQIDRRLASISAHRAMAKKALKEQAEREGIQVSMELEEAQCLTI